MDRRIGRFYVTEELIDSGDASKLFVRLDFVPLRAEALPYKGVYSYVGISPMFRVVAEGNKIPRYSIVCTGKWGSPLDISVSVMDS